MMHYIHGLNTYKVSGTHGTLFYEFMKGKKVLHQSVALLLLFCSGLSFHCASPVANNFTDKDVLTLTAQIPLPNVSGRIDHLAYDSLNHLAFIAALGNNTIEVVNIDTKQVIHSIKGLHEPQGVAYIPSLQKLVVANGANGQCIFFDAKNYSQLGLIDLKDDADN